MRYFNYLSDGDRKSLFSVNLHRLTKQPNGEMLRGAVGGLPLYSWGNHRSPRSFRRKGPGARLMAICLEDAVGDQGRDAAMCSIRKTFRYQAGIVGGSLSGIGSRFSLYV